MWKSIKRVQPTRLEFNQNVTQMRKSVKSERVIGRMWKAIRLTYAPLCTRINSQSNAYSLIHVCVDACVYFMLSVSFHFGSTWMYISYHNVSFISSCIHLESNLVEVLGHAFIRHEAKTSDHWEERCLSDPVVRHNSKVRVPLVYFSDDA